MQQIQDLAFIQSRILQGLDAVGVHRGRRFGDLDRELADGEFACRGAGGGGILEHLRDDLIALGQLSNPVRARRATVHPAHT
ncbi:hypothetical protein G6F62_015587 [Rhizopus arrhizus]|nr:hypothetical protein G6F62_015587 [Rhizopus arrhizus]